MSGFILFMMLFVSPPAAPGKQVWTLHSSTQLEFGSFDACKAYGKHLMARLDDTDTVTMRAWCINRASGASTFAVENPNKEKQSEPPPFEDIPVTRKIR